MFSESIEEIVGITQPDDGHQLSATSSPEDFVRETGVGTVPDTQNDIAWIAECVGPAGYFVVNPPQ